MSLQNAPRSCSSLKDEAKFRKTMRSNRPLLGLAMSTGSSEMNFVKMSSASKILAEHKIILPAKYDKKGQPNIVGSDEFPAPIAITEGQRVGSHHFQNVQVELA